MAYVKHPLRTFVCFVILLLFLPILANAGEENSQKDLPSKLSPALYLLADELPLTKTALKNCNITFQKEDFDRLLGVKAVDQILIASLPPITDGTLRLGETVVLKNQVIERRELDSLRFVPANDSITEAIFTFRAVGSEEYTLTCSLFLLDAINHAPTFDYEPSAKTSIVTYENIALHRTLGATDPEGDKLTFEIVSYPKKGILTLKDRNAGSYVYTPITDFVGKDEFTYRVTDQYGNRSGEQTVTIQIKENDASLVYQDMIGKQGQYPALRLTAQGIMKVQYENGSAVFLPEERVTKLEFLVMAMKAAGYRVSTKVDSTGFADDEAIDDTLKGYVSAAANMGFISGVEMENGIYFKPDSPITRADASVILSRMIDLPKLVFRPEFPDSDSIPTYAVDAMQTLSSLGILTSLGDEIAPMTTLNRVQSAMLLCAVMEYIELGQ